MKRILELGVLVTVLGAAGSVRAQEPPASGASGGPTGPRLRVTFIESRERDGKKTSAPPVQVVLQPGDKGASVFAGTQVPLRASGAAAPSVVFKNAGLQAEVTAHVEADGRFRIDASVEESAVLADTGVGGVNPVLQTVKAATQVVLRDGETAPFASAVDPVTGERVTLDVGVAATAKRAVSPAKAGTVRARFLLRRLRGGVAVVSRPYLVALMPGQEKPAYVFGGSMLPLEASYQGQATVMLKDVGAGLRVTATPLEGGRYRVALSLTDGALAAAGIAPRLQAVQVETQVDVDLGEALVVASLPDRLTGDVVEAELTLEPAAR